MALGGASAAFKSATTLDADIERAMVIVDLRNAKMERSKDGSPEPGVLQSSPSELEVRSFAFHSTREEDGFVLIFTLRKGVRAACDLDQLEPGIEVLGHASVALGGGEQTGEFVDSVTVSIRAEGQGSPGLATGSLSRLATRELDSAERLQVQPMAIARQVQFAQ